MNPIQQAIALGQAKRKQAWEHRHAPAHAAVLDVIRNARAAHALDARLGTDAENREYIAQLATLNVILQSLETDPNQPAAP